MGIEGVEIEAFRLGLKFRFALATACSLVAAGTAIGQTPEAGARTQHGATVLEEVIVTARKREESRQDVPLSVAAVSGAQLEAQGLRQIIDLTNKLPNFQMQTGTVNGLTNIAVRGIDTVVRNAGFNSSLSFYVDGIYQGRPANFNQDLADIERVELLLGPQGTLFGENTIAGVLNVVTRRPTHELEGYAEIRGGNYSYADVRGSLNIPLSSIWAMRVSGAGTEREGFQENVFTGKPQGNLHRRNGRIQLLGSFGATDVLFIGDYQRYNERPQSREYTKVVPSAGVPNFAGPPFTISQDESTSAVDRKGLALKIDHRLEVGGSISSVSSWKKSGSDEFFDQDYSSDPQLRGTIINNESERLISQELRYESDATGPLRYTVGAFYLDDKVGLNRVIDFHPPLILLGGLGALHIQIPAEASLESKSYAGFGNVEYSISPALAASVGIRYSRADQHTAYRQQELLLALGTTSTALAQQILGPNATGLLVANSPDYFDDRSEGAVSGTATLTYKFDSDRMAYARFARGTKTGGFNLEPLGDPVPPSRAFGPEKLNLFEVGFKSQWLNRRLLANVSIFYENYRDLQRPDVVPLPIIGDTVIIRNAGKVVVKGGELELSWIPVDGLTLHATYGYADSEIKEFTLFNGTDLSGRPLGGTPKWNGTLGANFVRPVNSNWDFFADASADCRGKRELGPSDATSVSTAGYTVLDARLGLRTSDGAWDISVWGKNVTDKLYVTIRAGQSDIYNAEGVGYGEPRMYGASLRYSFGAR